MGDVQGGAREANLGNVAGALASYRKALALQERLVATRPADRSLQGDLARTIRGLGDAQLMMRDVPAALDSYRRSLSIAEKLAAAMPGDRDAQRDVAFTQYRLAGAFGQLDDRESVNKNLQQAIVILKALVVDDADVNSRHALARSYKALGGLRAAQGDHRESLASADEALRLNQALAVADPVNMTVRNEVAMSHFEVGRAHLRLGNLEEALESSRRAETITASMAATDASNAQARWLQGLELNFGGVVLRRMQRQAEAVASHLEALALLEGVARADPTNESYQYNLANTRQLIGDAYVATAGASGSAVARSRAWIDARSAPKERRCVRRHDDVDAHWRRSDANQVAVGLALCDRKIRAAPPSSDFWLRLPEPVSAR